MGMPGKSHRASTHGPTRAWGSRAASVPASAMGEAPEQQPTLQLLDRSLLRDIGRSAQAFMDAVRALPHFRPVWNAGVLRSGFCIDGALDKSERTFRKHFAAATDLLDAQPLCPQDRFDISLCLYQRVPAVTARRIIACLS